jgi:hypothetical protein
MLSIDVNGIALLRLCWTHFLEIFFKKIKIRFEKYVKLNNHYSNDKLIV